MSYLLPLLILVPIFGAIVAAVIPHAASAKGWALAVSLATTVLAVVVAVNFPYYQAGSIVVGPASWLAMAPAGLTFSIGVDAISLCLVLLTVVADNQPAIALYEQFGFRPYGMEPRSLKKSSGYADEMLMVLFLADRTPRTV